MLEPREPGAKRPFSTETYDNPRRSSKARTLRLFSAFALLLVVAIPSVTFANDTPPSESGNSISEEPPAQISRAQLEEAVESTEPGESPETNSGPARSLLHEDLGREEAVELTEAVFDPVLEAAVGPAQGLEADRYLGEYAAVVPAGALDGSPPGDDSSPRVDSRALLESSTPLAIEGPAGELEPVDLSLQRSDSGFQPKTPVVDIEIPEELGEGLSVPGTGIRIEPRGLDPEVRPSIVNESVAIYPNVADDTDFSALSTPTGLETLTTLRGPDSPHSQLLHLTLPPGAVLQQKEGGAEVRNGGRTVVVFPAPTALDAAGTDVPVSLTVIGDDLLIETSPSPNAMYPILVDPMAEFWTWYLSASTERWQAWNPFTTNPVALNTRADTQGLELFSAPFAMINPGEQARWIYSVPRLSQEEAEGRSPQSFVVSAHLSHIGFGTEPGGPYSPYLIAGILGASGWAGHEGGQAVWTYWGNGPQINESLPGNGYEVFFENGSSGARDQSAKSVDVALASLDRVSTPQSRSAVVGGAIVEVADEGKPSTANGSESPWVNQTASDSISGDAEDAGLGVKSLKFDIPWKGWQNKVNSCSGGALSPCPRHWRASLAYEPAAMPQGLNFIRVGATDVLGSEADPSTTKAVVKVDHTAPELSVSGPLTEQASLGTTGARYGLKYQASDGDDGPPATLPQIGTAGTGAGQFQRPMAVAEDAAGNIWTVDRERDRVEKFGPDGKLLLEFGSAGTGNGQFTDPRGIALSASGNVWVADFASSRVQQFKPNGEYVSKFSTPASGQPYGLATGPGGAIWVAENARARATKYSESGTVLAEAANGLAGAIGVATDSAGKVYVTDAGKNEVRVFSSTGQLLTQFGTTGTGQGQFNGAAGIAIARSGHILVSDDQNGRIEVFLNDGHFLRAFGAKGSGLGQLQEPRGIAVGPNNRIVVADAANHRIAQWAHGDQDPESGVAKVQVKVDGQAVNPPLYGQSCPVKNCAANGEWVFNAEEYASGSHKVDLTATDGVGLTTTKTLTVTSVKDSTAPALTPGGALYSAPEGWVEQKSYSVDVSAADPGGSGITSLSLRIDGKQVKGLSQTCPGGACPATLTGSLNLGPYAGGAHPAELVAVDGAGFVTKKVWTINVDPIGAVTNKEATSTLEAVESTTESAPIAPYESTVSPEELEEGGEPGLEASSSGLVSTNTAAETTSSGSGQGNVAVETPVKPEDPGGTTTMIGVQPISNSPSASAPVVVGGVAAVSANARQTVDSVMRPRYNGLTLFQSIRSASAPEAFSWEVLLHPGQSLKSINESEAAVYYEEGTEAMLIRAESARDATGKSVSTSLAVTGSNVITLTVHHAIAGIVYPVVAGNAFEVGYSTVEVHSPPPPEPVENPNVEGAPWIGPIAVSAPLPVPETGEYSDAATASSLYGVRHLRKFGLDVCAPGGICEVWKMHIKGFYYYNGIEGIPGGKAWYTRVPKCEGSWLPSYNITSNFCDWIGGNYQPYGQGYHITMQSLFTVSQQIVVTISSAKHITLRGFGDGKMFPHDTAEVCNPSRPGC